MELLQNQTKSLKFLAMLCMLLEHISSTATLCHMDCSKELHQVNLLAIVNVYIGLLLFITVLKNGKISILMNIVHFGCGLVIELSDKENPQKVSIFAMKHERCYVFLPILYICVNFL